MDGYIIDAKALKWRIRHVLRKRNEEMSSTYLYLLYHKFNNEADRMLLNANFKEERNLVSD
jgi:hypothetical protein